MVHKQKPEYDPWEKVPFLPSGSPQGDQAWWQVPLPTKPSRQP